VIHPQHKKRLEALSQRNYNFDLARRDLYIPENGWNMDTYNIELPSELPGEPLKGGVFDIACSILREYRFPPPDLITGIFLPDSPLEKRVMLLRGRFMGFTFFFGVKVNGVIDSTIEDNQGFERWWGYNYATLEGHFEQGQIEFLIVKRLETGQVEFRISAFSKTGYIANPFYRIGFAIFGRGLQKRFAHESLKRMHDLVSETMRTGQKVGQTPEVKPASANSEAKEKMEQLEEIP
jgi:hypothetical protein